MGRGKHPKKKKNVYVKPPTDVEAYREQLDIVEQFIHENGYIVFEHHNNKKDVVTKKVYQFCLDKDKPEDLGLMRLIMRRKEKYKTNENDSSLSDCCYERQHDGIIANGRIKLKEMINHEFADLFESGYHIVNDSEYAMYDLSYKPEYEGLKKQIARIAKEKGVDTSLDQDTVKEKLKQLEKEERRKKKLERKNKKDGK